MNENATGTPAPQTVRTFRRSRDDRMMAGICGGAARMLDVDATLLRVILVLATVFGFGAGALAYVICWFVVPVEGSAR